MSRQASLTKTDQIAGRARSRSMSNTPSVGLGSSGESKLAAVPEPPDTPPPLEHAYASASGRSSACSTPELAVATPYAALHPSSRMSHSPEMAYAAHWQQPDAHAPRYPYADRDQQPPSPASSADSHYPAASPNAPYSYYGAQQGSSSQGVHPSKYESSPRKHRFLGGTRMR